MGFSPYASSLINVGLQPLQSPNTQSTPSNRANYSPSHPFQSHPPTSQTTDTHRTAPGKLPNRGPWLEHELKYSHPQPHPPPDYSHQFHPSPRREPQYFLRKSFERTPKQIADSVPPRLHQPLLP